MKTETLVILDHESTTVHIYQIAPDTEVDDDYLESLGLNPDFCSWMFGEFLEIVKHKRILQ